MKLTTTKLDVLIARQDSLRRRDDDGGGGVWWNKRV